MSRRLNLSDVCKHLHTNLKGAEATKGIARATVDAVVKELFRTLPASLQDGDQVQIRAFGTLTCIVQPEVKEGTMAFNTFKKVELPVKPRPPQVKFKLAATKGDYNPGRIMEKGDKVE